ncbi:PREDICTED: protein FD-like isoform X2 [Populus euphratica]|uniref:Protein FD-like isoform X2 n=1 Tax=Populus euphratica TaxID=75702 RepID=A0AAJ6T1Q8_POPEU|nr:PREDICTED: protein FD-like isoform X2 [Populus euphratica]
MWSSPGANIDNNNTSNSKVSGNSPSKCFSSTCSSPSPFSPPPPIPNQSMNGASMEEVWDDINLASLHDHSNTNTSSNNNRHSFNGMVFQDFLARPSNKDPSTRAASKEPSSGGGNSFLKNSLGPPPATMLSLNSGSDHFHYLESSDTVSVRPNPQMHSHDNGGTISFDSSLDSSFDALGSSSVFLSICKKRPQENGDVSGGDRRHKRMIKNRESAARSRARKQAYTVELEREAAHLAQENAKLRRQQERFLAAAPAQLPKKNTLYRTSTAPF